MDKRLSNLHFKLMALTYRFRDAVLPRERIIAEAGIKPGMVVLDYGCGPGSYVLPAAELVGKSGKVYALDIHPLAIESVERLISRKRLANVQTILSACDTGLQDDEADAVLLYDVLHDLGAPLRVLQELHRALKPSGVLSFSDHHLKHEEIVSSMTDGGLFKLTGKGKRSYTFSPRES